MLAALLLCLAAQPTATLTSADSPASGTWARYRVLPGGHREGQPFNVVEFTYGPRKMDGSGATYAWQLAVYPEDPPGDDPLFELRAATLRDPLSGPLVASDFVTYQLRIPAVNETLAYRNVHTGRALLPGWGDFTHHFLPRPATATRRQQGVPNSCEYLGHVLTLRDLGRKDDWAAWDDVKVLDLDPELLIGTGRTAKDREGHRLPQEPERQNYDYVPFALDDYGVMIEAGMNYFGLAAGSEAFIRQQPVFYRRGIDADEPLRYPADLYRSNLLASGMFMDEPTCIMVNNKTVHTTLKFFTDAAALITKHVRSQYARSIFEFENRLRQRGAGMGDIRLAELDIPTWETRYETAFYQMAGGASGIVHEGRYQLGEFNEFARASTGLEREHTPEEMFRYYYAFLRGAARHFGKDWGTSIYGQADPALSPTGVKLAYDMGARHIWYWTSDHDHHLPWPEQLELTRIIRRHAAEHPRPSIYGGRAIHRSLEAGGRVCYDGAPHRPALDKVIVIPYGYFLVLESPTGRKYCWDLWWVRELDAEGKNESSHRYRRLMRRAMTEVHKALDAGESFDITVDDGGPIEGYRTVVRVNDE